MSSIQSASCSPCLVEVCYHELVLTTKEFMRGAGDSARPQGLQRTCHRHPSLESHLLLQEAVIVTLGLCDPTSSSLQPTCAQCIEVKPEWLLEVGRASFSHVFTRDFSHSRLFRRWLHTSTSRRSYCTETSFVDVVFPGPRLQRKDAKGQGAGHIEPVFWSSAHQGAAKEKYDY